MDIYLLQSSAENAPMAAVEPMASVRSVNRKRPSMAAVDPVASVRSVRCKDNILLATNLWAPSPSAQI